MSVTIKDIAKKAGVSHTTVSRALRGSPLISVEVAERIRGIAHEMGYHPSVAARSLKTNRTQALGVIVSQISDPFFGEVLQGIDDVAQEYGYSTFIAAAQHDPEREQSIVRSMREHRVDGIIICSTSIDSERAGRLLSYQTPIVVINNQAADEYTYSIYHDDLDGSRQVVRHLLELGHRRIAYLGNNQSGRTNQERLSGYRQQLADAGLEIREDYIWHAPGSDPHMAALGLKQYLALDDIPTAIFCYNDMLAFGVLQGLHDAGVKVPLECSVAGFDNIAFSAYTNPTLTTLEQPKHHMGVEAARMLLGVLRKSTDHSDGQLQKILAFKGELLVRESTAALPRQE